LDVALPILTAAALTIVAYRVFFSNKSSTSAPTGPTNDFTAPKVTRKAASLDELLEMSPEQLPGVDIGEMNLLCGTGLPGAENLDIDRCLATLDRWAARVKFETERHLYRFARDPGNYENSEGYFRMLMLVTVLQQDFGVHYNKDRIREVDFRRSQDLFIHGMIDDDNGGTCVSMPVIYTAVARRLGYPVKLVLTKSHVFCRWDAPDDRINIEATNQGMNTFPDEYYLTWPEKISPAEARHNRYLVSLTPAEELASFLASRGHCLIDNGHTKEAFEAYAAAHRLAPKRPAYLAWTRDAQRRLQPPTFGRGPRGFREPPMVYRYDPLREVRRINAINRANSRFRHGYGRQVRRIQPALAAIAMVTAGASAMYHPGIGRFLQRDPGPGAGGPARVGNAGPALGGRFIARDPTAGNPYADGMNLYQYLRSDAVNSTDPMGLRSYDECLDRCSSGGTLGRATACVERCLAGPDPQRTPRSDATLKMPIFTLSPGLSGSVAFYSQALPPLTGVYVKVTGTEKRGSCCQDGRERFYVQHSVSAEGGVYGGKPGFRARFTMPLVEFKKKCPKTEEWHCEGFFKVGVRLSLISASCTWEYGSGWDCGVGIRLKWKDLARARVTVGGGVRCAQTKVSDNPMP